MFELTTLVQVLVPGVYNGRGHRALPRAERGDLIQVAAGGYGQSLIADGYVTDNLEPLAEENDDTAPNVTDSLEPLTEDENDTAPSMDEGEGESLDTHDALNQVAAEDRLAEVKGIGAATAKQLVEAGVTSWQGLVEADTAVLAEALNTTEKRVQGWQSAAQDLLDEQEEEGV